MKIVIVGLGGIGSNLVDMLSQFIQYADDPSNDTKIRFDGAVRMILIDGDSYEHKNKSRQSFNKYGNKAEVKCEELSNKYSNITYSFSGTFIDSENISEFISENDVVFVGVDNHASRKIISDYACTLDNITVISGGNDYINGNAQLYIRQGGEDVTPSLTDYHPEIQNPADNRLPNEMSCEELYNSEPQLYFTNLHAALFMAEIFYNILNGNGKMSEVYFDIVKMIADCKFRKPKLKTQTKK